MAVRSMEMGLVAVLMTMLWAGASAQLSCTPTIMSLSPCLNYITGNSSTPSPSCCSQLASVVRSQAQCLCMLFNGSSSSMGFNFNQTQVLALPGACNVQTPPISQCNAASGPVTSPGDSPAEAPVEAPTSPPTSATATAPVTPPPSVPITPSTKPSAPAVPSQTPPSAPSIPRNGSKTVPSTSGGSSLDESCTTFLIVFFLGFASYASYGGAIY
ncbi:non-specific lipid transfer protein GPI-anchored 5-like [Magnolia sinica]|uniref:non-specific lipid transfer protein GPI-anchored 5-like n=1 Tax=Magnolia sinica TaxID=86752 RepID=UPI00265A7A33|nr:non-specific lipid transfer protein GPI-anchored 5-like [Magnolia sinica]